MAVSAELEIKLRRVGGVGPNTKWDWSLVDAEGKVSVTGHGEAAITVWYSNLVALSQVVSPLPNKVEAKVFTSATRNNYIDDLVLKKLRPGR